MPSLQILLTRLGQVIRSLRERAGYSQERFGFAIKRHRTYVGLLERGKANPTVKTLYLMAEGLGVSVPELFALTATEGGSSVSVERNRPRQGKDIKTAAHKTPPTAGPGSRHTKGAREQPQKRRKTRE